MPLSGNEFEKKKNPMRYIVDFLRKNKDTAFTGEEIANGVNIPKEIILPILNLIPLAEVLATYAKRQVSIFSVTVDGVTYYKYNENYRE